MNNRQNNRRRSRGNNRQQNNRGGGVDHQNRIDNRARGNASQMLDKYKKLAQDAQLNGDRVQNEYYLQFADHYFRVLADFKARQEARQEEQNNRRQRDDNRDDERDYDDDDRDTVDQEDDAAGDEDDGDERASRKSRTAHAKPRQPRKGNGKSRDDGENDSDGIDLAVLPPAISAGEEDEKPKRKPRARRVKTDDDGAQEVAAAAE